MDENSKTEPCSSVGNAFKAEGFETKTLASNSVLLGRFFYTRSSHGAMYSWEKGGEIMMVLKQAA
jgi:hypothetical protein